MGISIGVGAGNKIGLAAEGDLAKRLQPGLDVVLQLGDTLKQLVGLGSATLADVPHGGVTAGFSTDQTAKWDVGSGANVGVTFRPEAQGSVRFTSGGDVLSAIADGAHKGDFAVAVPDGAVVVSVEFLVNLNVAGTAAFSSGNIGVKANLGLSDQFRIANHRAFPSSMRLVDALAKAFSEFQLPFRSEAVLALGETDLVEFEFTGRLSAGLGLTFAMTAPVIAGRGVSELTSSLGHGLAKASLRADPTFRAGAEFGIKYTQDGAFRFVFARDLSRAAKPVSLLMFRRDESDLERRESFGLTVDPGLKFNFATNADKTLDRAVDQMFGPASIAGAEALKKQLKTAGAVAVKALSERINESVNELLQPADGGNTIAQIEFLQKTTDIRTVLFRLTFDGADEAARQRAIELALRGDIAAAVAAPGCELSPGSFVETQFIRRSGFGFQLFDLWKFTDVVEYARSVEVVYAGGGMLRLIAKTGVSHASGIFGREGRCDAYFTSQGAEVASDGSVSGLSVAFTFELLDRTPGQARETERLLNGFGSTAATAIASRIVPFTQAGGPVRTTCVFHENAFSAFQADPYDGHDKPGPMPHPADAANYAAFARAAEDIDRFLGFKRYEDWCVFNTVANDGEGSRMVPDRRNRGNLAQWPNEFIHTRQQDRQFQVFHSESARRFMNLCEALHSLQREADAVTTDRAFLQFVTELNGIIQNDVPESFLKATLLALMRLSGAQLQLGEPLVDAGALAIPLSMAGKASAAVGPRGV